MKILGVCGSLQRRSSNLTVLRTAQAVCPQGDSVQILSSLEKLPHFNPEHDVTPAPAAIAVFRQRLRSADALLISAPEYAHGMPGALKDALDWLVSSGELYETPVGVLVGSPRPNGGTYAKAALEQTLNAQGAMILVSELVWIREPDKQGELLSTPEGVEVVRRAVERLAGASGSAALRE